MSFKKKVIKRLTKNMSVDDVVSVLNLTSELVEELLDNDNIDDIVCNLCNEDNLYALAYFDVVTEGLLKSNKQYKRYTDVKNKLILDLVEIGAHNTDDYGDVNDDDLDCDCYKGKDIFDDSDIEEPDDTWGSVDFDMNDSDDFDIEESNDNSFDMDEPEDIFNDKDVKVGTFKSEGSNTCKKKLSDCRFGMNIGKDNNELSDLDFDEDDLNFGYSDTDSDKDDYLSDFSGDLSGFTLFNHKSKEDLFDDLDDLSDLSKSGDSKSDT